MMMKGDHRIILLLALLISLDISFVTTTFALPSINLLDAGSRPTSSGDILQLQLQTIPSTLSTSNGVVTIIRSPGTPSLLKWSDEDDDSKILTLVTTTTTKTTTTADSDNNEESQLDDVVKLVCRGATLQGTTDIERSSLAFCSLISDSIIIDGVTRGDIQVFRNSRHSRTLTVLFRSKLFVATQPSDASNANNSKKKQLLILVVEDDSNIDSFKEEVIASYQAAAIEKQGSPPFDDLYNLRIMSDTKKILSEAVLGAKNVVSSSGLSSSPVSAAFALAWTAVQDESGSGTMKKSLAAGLDPPYGAQAFVAVMNAHAKYTRSATARIMQWKKRVARGLWIDSFGTEATKLRRRCLYNGYDTETLSAAGLPQVGQYRFELRNQLQVLIDTAVEDLFNKQVANIQSATVKRFQASLLKDYNDEKNTYESNEASINANAALLRQQSFAAESALDDIAVPVLGLTKEKSLRTITSALNDALLAFPDSPAAKLKRTKFVANVVTKETRNKKKKPGSRSLGFGLDLVAMIRPDGFGTLQGFAGYALPAGNTITVGIHNDADDPQVIAQFGGVRPPLLRVQPKLRIDVEL